MRKLLVVLLALAAPVVFADESLCNYYQPMCASKKAAFDNDLKRINDSANNKKISVTAAIKESASLISKTYPEDPLMVATARQLNDIASLSVGQDQKEKLADGAFAITAQAYSDRRDLMLLAQSADKKPPKNSSMDAYVRTANAMASERAQYEADNDPMEPMRRAVALSALFSGIGKAFATSWGQSITPPSTICNTYGGTMYCYPPY